VNRPFSSEAIPPVSSRFSARYLASVECLFTLASEGAGPQDEGCVLLGISLESGPRPRSPRRGTALPGETASIEMSCRRRGNLLKSCMNSEPLDTSPSALSVQSQAHIRLGPEGRLRLALELSEAVRDLRLAGLRSVAPGASEAELARMFIAETHGFQPGSSP
jgi:hypothetical protein